MVDDQIPGQELKLEHELNENSVEYIILCINEAADSGGRLSRLEAVRREALQLCQSVAKDYIWQRDEFKLELKTEKGLTFLHGITDYGDAVEDEWLIVYLLRRLSQSHADLWIHVADEDGEFLLIEAANVLPKWLSPEIDKYRPWIHKGKLLIIPCDKDSQETSSSSDPRVLSLPDAVQVLKTKPDTLVHSAFVESEAFYRLEKYPEHVNDSIHYSRVTIPRKLAYVLHTLPKSVAPAVEAFYLRDPVSLKPIIASSAPLTFPPEDLVDMSVRFSKILFAQLRSQRFDVPPRWQKVFQETQEAGGLDGKEKEKAISRLETGMKLTCGFEILALSAEKNKSRVVREVAIMLDDLQEDGPEALPTDEDIKAWPEYQRDDSEAWMDINYQDFEKELEGRRQGEAKGGFGDDRTQADLRKIVARFEAFLNDDTAGLDGAELDDMDVDDDNDDDESSDDGDYEDKAVSFDEEEFSRMMREMMGLPPTEPARPSAAKGKEKLDNKAKATEDDDDDDKEIQELAAQMESELREQGALALDPPKEKGRRLKEKSTERAGRGSKEEDDGSRKAQHEDSEGEEVDIDYNLAKNLLESFKSQAGMAGPTGNLLGLMGFQLPRDEDDGTEEGAQKDGASGSSRRDTAGKGS